ncbi:MAG: class I SAM-dependent methyltransferase [Desulfobacterota bacterium]|nr:class I SAM-dependent methyltransferase [Thermodesulfobacteriota bacterium]
MQRIPEEELMTESAQARAYAAADFDEPHSAFIKLFQEVFGDRLPGSTVIDLGCGPGDITFRFARAYPQCIVHGVDGSDAMLAEARRLLARTPDLAGRVLFIKGMLPDIVPPLPQYDVVISNSLLHHLSDPQVLWKTITCCASPGAAVFVVDLKRPESPAEAQRLTERYCSKEPEILQRDFYNSLCAAFEPSEIRDQLQTAGLNSFIVREISDRHVMIAGIMRS